MRNKVKDIHLKNQTYYLSHEMINMKNFDANNIAIDGKIFLFTILDM